MKTPNIFEGLDENLPQSENKNDLSDPKHSPKSLDSPQKIDNKPSENNEPKLEETKKNNQDENNSWNCSLIRIKSEHNLQVHGNSEAEGNNLSPHEDPGALRKLNGTQNFNQRSPSPE